MILKGCVRSPTVREGLTRRRLLLTRGLLTPYLWGDFHGWVAPAALAYSVDCCDAVPVTRSTVQAIDRLAGSSGDACVRPTRRGDWIGAHPGIHGVGERLDPAAVLEFPRF
jgi:hypothetical protein